jgi:hypothetical protein
MKKFRFISILFVIIAFLLNSTALSSQTITVDGNAYLENQTNHEGIKIVFERIAPASLIDSTYSYVDGYFSIEVGEGIYSIKYEKTGYFESLKNDQPLFTNTTLEDVTLLQYTTLIIVPTMISTIQGAIDIAYPGDTVLIQPGTYFENINLIGKSITVASQYLLDLNPDHIAQTVIDGGQNGHVVEVSNGEDTTTRIIGLTITNGYVSQDLHSGCGGGIYCNLSSPTLSNLNVVGNTAEVHGGGIYIYTIGGVEITIKSCLIQGNSCTNNPNTYGGGLYLWGNSVHLINTIVMDNDATAYYNAYGGGIYSTGDGLILTNTIITNNIVSGQTTMGGAIFSGTSYSEINNSVIAGNTANSGGGVYLNSNQPFFVWNSIFYNNSDYALYSAASGEFDVNYCDFYDNEAGVNNLNQWMGLNVTTNDNEDSCDVYNNIILSPQFTDAMNNNFQLQSSSPCIDAGDNESVSLGHDMDYNFRVWDGNNDGSEIVDMGCYEFGSLPFFPISSSFISPDSICVSDTVFIEYTGTASQMADYFWDFDNAEILSGMGQGPYEVLWEESGTKIISLYVSEHGILSTTTTNPVMVSAIPSVYAGQDTTIRAGESYTIPDAEAESYESLLWSTSGDGFFDDTTILHAFYTPGPDDIINRNVTLSLKANSMCGNDSDEMILNINSHISLSGSIYHGNENLEGGVAVIFEIGDDYYLPIQYAFVDNGYYSFDSLFTGNYVVYAIPDPYVVPGYFPSYHVDQLYWQNANIINLEADTCNVDIHLLEMPERELENGSISGVVNYESLEVYEEEIYQNDWFGNTTGIPFGAWNMCVFLWNDQGDVIDWTLSDESGIFQFVDLPYGQFSLTLEKAGFQLSDNPMIVLDSINPSVEGIEIEIKAQDITVNLPENISYLNKFNVYPNPVSNWLNIEFKEIYGDIKVELFTLTGNRVFSKHTDKTSVHEKIDVSFLESGIYIGEIQSDGHRYFFKIIK